MERLTYWLRDQHGAKTKFAAYNMNFFGKHRGENVVPITGREQMALNLLAAYEDAEEQGRLVMLPCKVGDMVYALWPVPSNAKFIPYCAEIKQIKIAKRACRTMVSFLLESVDFRGRLKEYFDDEFGKTVFLTREEAEAALKKVEKDA